MLNEPTDLIRVKTIEDTECGNWEDEVNGFLGRNMIYNVETKIIEDKGASTRFNRLYSAVITYIVPASQRKYTSPDDLK